LSFEIAERAFGAYANELIEKCINYIASHTDSNPPYLILTPQEDSSTSRIELKADFRHTLAFGVILARANRNIDYLRICVELALARQYADGGWPPGEGETISELYSAMYAVELLTLCDGLKDFASDNRNEIIKARDNGIRWLMSNVSSERLWHSGVLKTSWDGIWATSWILHRLSPISNGAVQGWTNCLGSACDQMIRKTLEPQLLEDSPNLQRFRVEARVAAAITVAVRSLKLSTLTSVMIEDYLKDWKRRTLYVLNTLPDNEMDLATSLFLIEALIEREELTFWGSQVHGVINIDTSK
jgi:hypothetical protein